ncbi:MAG TPA: class II glutamine amidotransferase [Candidatus Binatia bacterium]|nr:class II glutamine amidotransferase [Candidatus Binatia bacterium]
MCELFGMASRFPTNVTFSLSLFGERGGHRGPHKDGWGIAFNEGRDFRMIKEAAPASDSACLRFIETHDFRSQIVISHIRRASAPTVPSLANSHPFARELYGFTHVFAHNGEVLGVFQAWRFEPKYYFPLGDTDSKRAFCALLDRLREELTPATVMNLNAKLPIIENWAREASSFGVFNFLLSDTHYLCAHRSSQLFYVSRECASQSECWRSGELTIRLAESANGLQRVAVVATEPLTDDEAWQPLAENRIAVFCSGENVG